MVRTGDLDGDGAADLVGYAWGESTGGGQAGAVYVLYGPLANGSSFRHADATILGTRPGDYLGEGLAIVDLDADGADDLVVGAPGPIPGFQPGMARRGEAYLFYGGKRLDGTIPAPEAADATFMGVHDEDFLGVGLAPVGDFNGDGTDDLMVGAAGTAGYSGAAYLFAGGQRYSGTVGVERSIMQVTGAAPASFASWGASGGDINGDGLSDMIIGSPSANPAAPSGAYAIFGMKTVALSLWYFDEADVRFVGEPGSWTGFAVDSSGDLNRDGIDDVVLGADARGFELTDSTGPGAAHVIFGDRALVGKIDLSDASVTVAGKELGDATGSSVLIADVNGDRKDDLVVGSPGASDRAGAVHVFFGPIKPTSRLKLGRADVILRGKAGEGFGFALAADDLLGDRSSDLVVGAPGGGTSAKVGAGKVYVFRGGATVHSTKS
ncbi:MAG: integrin alpha [Actinomycetota bacterium]|nr:integrin alpha [Actinomycetota bacterium]